MKPWSPSQVRSYRTCPRQWMLRYRSVDSSTREGGANALPRSLMLGTAAHAGLEAAYRAARESYAPATTMAVYADVAIDAIRVAWSHFTLDEDEDSIQVENEVVAVLHALPRPRPASISGVEIVLSDQIEGIPFVNVVDLILRTGPTSLHIRDWKRMSLRSLPKTMDLGDDPQLCSYRHAVARHFPWVATVTVGLYSLVSNREVCTELPLARADRVMRGVVATVCRAEDDTECVPTPDGTNCQRCPVKRRCPVWT